MTVWGDWVDVCLGDREGRREVSGEAEITGREWGQPSQVVTRWLDINKTEPMIY